MDVEGKVERIFPKGAEPPSQKCEVADQSPVMHDHSVGFDETREYQGILDPKR
jgi:hypothetical protein